MPKCGGTGLKSWGFIVNISRIPKPYYFHEKPLIGKLCYHKDFWGNRLAETPYSLCFASRCPVVRYAISNIIPRFGEYQFTSEMYSDVTCYLSYSIVSCQGSNKDFLRTGKKLRAIGTNKTLPQMLCFNQFLLKPDTRFYN